MTAGAGSRPERWTTLKADHPRTIDRYIDFFGAGTVSVQGDGRPTLPEDVDTADRPVDRDGERGR